MACALCFCSFLFVVFCLCLFALSRWSFVDVPLIVSCPADHVPDWQARILLRIVGVTLYESVFNLREVQITWHTPPSSRYKIKSLLNWFTRKSYLREVFYQLLNRDPNCMVEARSVNVTTTTTATPSGHSRVYRVTQLRTDGVHCRESAGTGPVNLKVVPNECCLGRSPWTN